MNNQSIQKQLKYVEAYSEILIQYKHEQFVLSLLVAQKRIAKYELKHYQDSDYHIDQLQSKSDLISNKIVEQEMVVDGLRTVLDRDFNKVRNRNILMVLEQLKQKHILLLEISSLINERKSLSNEIIQYKLNKPFDVNFPDNQSDVKLKRNRNAKLIHEINNELKYYESIYKDGTYIDLKLTVV